MAGCEDVAGAAAGGIKNSRRRKSVGGCDSNGKGGTWWKKLLETESVVSDKIPGITNILYNY